MRQGDRLDGDRGTWDQANLRSMHSQQAVDAVNAPNIAANEARRSFQQIPKHCDVLSPRASLGASPALYWRVTNSDQVVNLSNSDHGVSI